MMILSTIYLGSTSFNLNYSKFYYFQLKTTNLYGFNKFSSQFLGDLTQEWCLPSKCHARN